MKSENNYERIVQNSKKFQHSQKNEMQKRITDLLQQLTNGIHERDQIMAVSLLGAIAGHNTFLFGPPGTAKSLMAVLPDIGGIWPHPAGVLREGLRRGGWHPVGYLPRSDAFNECWWCAVYSTDER